MELFEKYSHQYDTASYAQSQAASWAAEWLEPNLAPYSAMEYGSGTGLFSQYILQSNPAHLLATDSCQKMLNLAQLKKLPASFQCLNAWSHQKIPVDRIYSASILHWSPNPAQTIKNWAAQLPISGKMLHVFFTKGTLTPLAEILKPLTHINWLNQTNWIKPFTSASLRILRHDCLTINQTFHSPIAALRCLQNTGGTPYHGKTPIPMVYSLIKKLQSQHSPLTLSWNAMRIECQK